MTAPPVIKPHKYRPGTVALRKIRKYQKTFELLLKKAAFRRLSKEVMDSEKVQPKKGVVTYFAEEAYDALQEAAKARYLVKMCEEANLYAIHAKRVTLMESDWALMLKLRHGEWRFPVKEGPGKYVV
ncbi:histone H3 [Klebsormidium nitens]|uniref:Histone H3 n=1 Tax=Klebsormidium nitens TaxID=105231 RepID=A0A1Y1IQC7_KLENI|nr:histone H3 [Klebsormidium nitens]|eukprot:GAQ91679.1 histone H3 [Klebsormidium nitens]